MHCGMLLLEAPELDGELNTAPAILARVVTARRRCLRGGRMCGEESRRRDRGMRGVGVGVSIVHDDVVVQVSEADARG